VQPVGTGAALAGVAGCALLLGAGAVAWHVRRRGRARRAEKRTSSAGGLSREPSGGLEIGSPGEISLGPKHVKGEQRGSGLPFLGGSGLNFQQLDETGHIGDVLVE
jgi:hypothetical protein